MYTEIGVAILILIYLSWDFLFGKRLRNYPPGPMRYPIVGNLPQFGSNPLACLQKWKSTYGNIVGLRMGDFNVVVLNTYEVIKEAFEKPEFSGRPDLGIFLLIAGGKKRGLLVTEGEDWVEQRRFALRHLKDFGFGKKSMESMIQEDASQFLQSLEKDDGKPVATNRRLSAVVLCALWNIISGERFAHGDPRFTSVLDNLNAVFGDTSVFGPVFFMPWLAKLAPKLSGWDAFATAVSNTKSLVGNIIENHKTTFDSANLRDFMDVYLNQIGSTEDPKSSFFKEKGDENILVVMVNLFGAGGETTSNTLNWAIYFLAKNQEVQQKVQEELDSVVGRDRLPGFDDQDLLVYTKAVMEEVFRNSSFVPFGVFHKTMDDVKFHGYDIPKDTVVMANLYDVHHDKDVWGDPENFRPERFLNLKEGEKVGHVIPFSVGKRACLGETLARKEFFLILSSTFQRYHLKFHPNNLPEDRSESRPSLFRFAPKFKVLFEQRY